MGIKDKSKEKDIEGLIEQIEPDQEDFINRRINHISFAKVVFWLGYQSRKQDFVYASELAKFLKVTHTRAYTILRDLCRAGIMSKTGATSSLIEFRFIKNGQNPLIIKYTQKAMKTLNLEE